MKNNTRTNVAKRLLMAVVLSIITLSQAWAYDFSVVVPSGQTLYFSITSNLAPYKVRVTYPSSSSYPYSGYTEPTGNLVIPNTITYQGTTYSVTSIGNYAFSSCSGLTSVTIPNSVTSIGEAAFSGCSGLTTLNFNAINCGDFWGGEYHTFYNCPIATINIGDSVQRIPANFAYNLDSLNSITIPNSVTSIGNLAFYDCSGLTSVTIPNSVTSIGNYAFSSCSGLTSVTIPNSVTSIGNYAFSSCSGLTSVTIPNSVTSIGNYAFSSCSGLTSVTIPNSVTSIGVAAFRYCSGLTSVTIPNSVTSIEYEAFGYCIGLTSVTIPNSVTSIGREAFFGCSGLTSVTIPNSVTSIGEEAFYLVKNIIYNGTATGSPWGALSVNGYIEGDFVYANNTKTSLLAYIGTSTSVAIPNSVTSIGNSAFYNCSGLTSVTIPNSVTSIGSSAFAYCDGLTSVTIPNSVTSIGNYAFYDCSGLTSVTIPNSVTSIGEGAFENCSGLTTLNFNAINCGNFSSSYHPFYNCPIATINIGDSVQRIPAYFAYGKSSLTSVTIPNSVTSIGNYAFYYCSGLTSVTIGNSVTSIGEYAFSNCSGLTSVTIPNSVTSIGEYAFSGCSNLRDVTSLAVTPPTLGTTVFSVAGILKVPCGSLSAYRYSAWLDYFTIMEEICDNMTITVTSANESMGTVSGSGEYAFGTVATITATPNEGYHFVSWNDGNTDNPRTITVTEDATYIANFAEEGEEVIRYTITVLSANESMGTVSGGGEYEVGTEITITAIPNEGYRFVSWNDGDTDNPRTITVTEDATYIATFEEGVGIESRDMLSELTFYPNPTSGIITFNRNDIMKVEVLDAMGKMVAVYENAYTIDISKLAKGYYAMRITTAEGVAVRKVVRK